FQIDTSFRSCSDVGREIPALNPADELFERLPPRPRRPLPGRPGLRAPRARGVAEGEDELHLGPADLGGGLLVADAVRTGRHALAPRTQHHVLGATADVDPLRV